MELDSADTAGYSLRRVLGSGPAGTAWLVRDRASGRNAVLKHLPIHAFTDPGRFRDDLKILERLRHPHLARLLEYRETGKAWILITEYAVAGSLEALLARRARLTHGELVTLLTPLAQALDHLHRAGLTHGALTPSNIVFDATGRPLLTDPALRPQTPTTDYESLATIAHDTAADPAPFPQDLFVKTPPAELPRRLHAIAPPAPIDLATHKIQPLTDLPANRTATPPDDDTTELSLGL
jgi:serine/threonine protein kinase